MSLSNSDRPVSRGAAAAGNCTNLAAALAEPLAGSAAMAGTWLCLEQRGPWGHDAARQSHLDPAVGDKLAARAEAVGARLQLIRDVGPHPDKPGPRRAYLAHTHPEQCWLRQADLDDPAELLDLDLDAAAHGRHGDWGRSAAGPLLLVCTNGRRDRCCAMWGRALLADIGEPPAGSIWETSHTGGHRFSPTGVLLPSGYTYGRLDGANARAALSAAAAGEVVIEGCRGRSSWSGAGQAAELAVRQNTGEREADSLRVGASEGDGVEVLHRDGRRWVVTVRRQELDPPRRTSCGTQANSPYAYVAGEITAQPERPHSS